MTDLLKLYCRLTFSEILKCYVTTAIHFTSEERLHSTGRFSSSSISSYLLHNIQKTSSEMKKKGERQIKKSSELTQSLIQFHQIAHS